MKRLKTNLTPQYKLTAVLFIILYCISTGNLLSQQKKEMQLLLYNAQQVLYSNPEQSLKFAQHIAKNSKSSKEIIQSYLLISKSYLIEGKYGQAIEASENAKRIAEESNDDSLHVSSLSLLSEIMNFLNITDLSTKYNDEAKQIIKRNSKLHKEFKEIEISEIIKKDPKLSPEMDLAFAKITKGTLFTQIAKRYLERSDYDMAFFYFSKSMENLEKKTNMDYWEMLTFIDYSDYFFNNKQYETAVEVLYKAVEKQKKINNPFYEKEINEKLMKSFIALKDSKKSQEYYQKLNIAEVNTESQLSLANEWVVNNYENKKNNIVHLKERKQKNIIYISLTFLLIIVVVVVIFQRSYNLKIKNKKDLIHFFEIMDQSNHQEQKNKSLKPISVSLETEKNILTGLDKFEKSNKFLNDNMSLPLLASQLNTNTKYLSKILSDHKQKNFNFYVNELRINYIINKLKTDPQYLNFKVSYLAEECGFASHNSFTFAFKKHIGMSPITFIDFIKEDKKNNAHRL
ncbi:helix-turn-helix domain-containing protein [Chryseobacterium antibioticum]|uniref:Helix-turn-helix domain-containing protein n=1 Tax=Chryseobacterium pyrolae TaxID=2987481 RepID=A0ABT2ICA5_9FLAO|nr:helix-turn-helix domain-containing protein [Chryseobacterium pyrolae]MCT2406263.1 helix-turn-helix domain-containing protein [Chryseobacterium pyrolae]